jgi:uncharacterized protein YjiS (DUF1127 family)
MNTSSQALPAPAAPRGIVDSMLERVRTLAGAIRLSRRRSAFMLALQALDDRTLHDIGLHRSEIGSVVAELIGDAPVTRRRS